MLKKNSFLFKSGPMLCTSFTMLLASCGGGASGDAATGSAATQTLAYRTSGSATSTSWTNCASEDALCSFSGTKQVRYGANGTYVYKNATNSIQCSNAVFGDPLVGADKSCAYSSAVTTATTPTTTTPTTTAPTTTTPTATTPTATTPTTTTPTTTTPTAANALPTDSIFAPNSFWYTPIPANAPLHANSASFVSDFQRQIKTYYGNVTINTTDYASPVFIADATTPTTSVGFLDCQGKGSTDAGLMSQWSAVPIPSNASPADGTDQEMTIYQPSTNTMWEFWVTQKSNGKWQACWGGQMKNTSTNQGIWASGYGTTATGLPFLGGQITAEELKRGEIRHAIGIALVDSAAWNNISWPAQRGDGTGSGVIPEGSRFRLNPSVNVDALNMHPAAKIIAKAAQKYGFVVWDKAGAISIRVQNPKSYTALGQPDPYVAIYNGTPNYSILNGFPWDQLQFMPKDYGKP